MNEAEIDAVLVSLEKLGHDSSGWDTLYRNRKTGELWEVTYPESQQHGGGPRHLSAVAVADAQTKYPDLFPK